jgi:hypothetical protein
MLSKLRENRKGYGRLRSFTVLPAACLFSMTIGSVGLPAGPTRAGEARDEARDGVGASYWGTIPAPVDSVTAVFTQRSAPALERALLVPYTVLKLPISALKQGLKGTVIGLDRGRVLHRVGSLLGPRQGPFGLLLNFQAGGLSGFGGGLTAVHDSFFSPDARFKLRWQSSVRSAHRVTLGIRLQEGSPTGFEVGAGYRVRPNARFFGIGPRAGLDGLDPDSVETFYSQEITWAGAGARRVLAGDLAGEATILFSAAGARRPGNPGDDRPIEEVHEKPVGYQGRSDGVTASLALLHDDTVDQGRPESGGLRRVKVSRFLSTDGSDLGFWTFRGELEQFLPLWFSKRALALRGFISWIEEDQADVPFQRLLTNDEPDQFRGYRDFRWRDDGITGFSAEYRWPIWAGSSPDGFGLDAFLFTDVGQVFGDFDGIARDNLTYSYGGGVRVAGFGSFAGLVQIAGSDEETVIHLTALQNFQFSRGGLFHGRDQVAIR